MSVTPVAVADWMDGGLTSDSLAESGFACYLDLRQLAVASPDHAE